MERERSNGLTELTWGKSSLTKEEIAIYYGLVENLKPGIMLSARLQNHVSKIRQTEI